MSRFDYGKLSGLMGGRNSTVYLTIMRDPVDIFVSEWFYYRLDGRYSMSLGQHQVSFRGVSGCRFLQSHPCMLGPICICVFIPDQFALAPDSVTRKKPGSGLLGPDIYNEEEVTMKIALMTSRI